MSDTIYNFTVYDYVEHSVYPGRFAKAKFFKHEIVMDTWSGMINATKFCNNFKGKAFKDYIKVEERRVDINELYEELKSVEIPSWEIIYNKRNGLYIIEGNQEAVKEIGGTYVHYYSIIDIGCWCDYALKTHLYDLLTLVHNYLQVKHDATLDGEIKVIRKVQNCLYDLRTLHENEEGESPSLLTIFKQLINCREAREIDKTCFTCKGIFVYLNNRDNFNIEPNILSIKLSFHEKSIFDLEKKEITINIDNLPYYISLIDNLFNENQNDESLSEDSISDNSIGDNEEIDQYLSRVKEIYDNLTLFVKSKSDQHIQEISNDVKKLEQEITTLDNKIADLSSRYDAIKEGLLFNVDIEGTLRNINNMRNSRHKKRYLEYFNNYQLDKIPFKLILILNKRY